MRYYKHFLISLIIINLSLSSCFPKNDVIEVKKELDKALNNPQQPLTPEQKKIFKNRCVTDRFAQGEDDNLYGKECLEGMKVFIKTDKEGPRVDTSKTINNVRIEEGLDIINKVYSPQYTIIGDEWNNEEITYLRDLFPENHEFYGSLDRNYDIIFETTENYLILYKASKELDDIPHIERTSMRYKDDYYMVPFLGYPIRYCNPVFITNAQGENTNENRCEPSDSPKEGEYIKIVKAQRQAYQFKRDKDLFPSSYFDEKDLWFFVEGSIQTPTYEGELSPFLSARLIRFKKTLDTLEVVDASRTPKEEKGELNEVRWGSIDVEWKNYKMDRDGDKINSFKEMLDTQGEAVKSPYMLIKKPVYITSDFFGQGPTEAISSIIDFLVGENYLSITLEVNVENTTFIHKYSFLKKSALDEKGFAQRKWFREDHDKYFGILWTNPLQDRKEAEYTEDEFLSSYRMIRFNTRKEETTEIKWYFSKNSVKDNYFRNIAREAVKIYNQAFQIITANSGKSIKVTLEENEEKDLGDMRYNIINLVKAESIIGWGNLLGAAPSYTNPTTGQIIGATANVILHAKLEINNNTIRKHIRHEIFQKDKNTKGGTAPYVLNPYMREQINEKCPEVADFINRKKDEKPKPGDVLGDRDIIISCSQKISRDSILATLIHEMGHNFGLAHNFKASVDKNNSYQSVEEIRTYFPSWSGGPEKIPEGSSVMDYRSAYVVPMTILGKYDFAALQFLYMDRVEKKDGTFLPLPPKDPDDQEALTEQETILSQKKEYLHCSDFGLRDGSEQNYLCSRFDHGYSPREIAEFQIQRSKYLFDSVRYRYDGASLSPPVFVAYSLTEQLKALGSLFWKWITIRNQYLISIGKEHIDNYEISEAGKRSIETYNQIIEGNLNNSENKKYKDFYELREPIYDYFKEIFFMETMKCELTDDKGSNHSIDLELIKVSLLAKYQENLYVEDCYSPMIQEFFSEQNLQLTGQKGIESFVTGSYLFTREIDVFDVISLDSILMCFMSGCPVNKETKFSSFLAQLISAVVAYEPAFYEDLRLRIEKNIINRNDLSITDLRRILFLYGAAFKQVMQKIQSNDTTNDSFEINKKYLSSVSFENFQLSVQEKLEQGFKIESFKYPFLTEEYHKWVAKNQQLDQEKQNLEKQKQNLETQLKSSSEIDKQSLEAKIQNLEAKIQKESESQIDFISHLAALPTTIYNREENKLIIPVQPGNFAEKAIVKYNENLKTINSLNDITFPNFLEIIERKQKEAHNEALLKIIGAT